jgi:L-iditol 2-dehydrogenase
LVEPLATSLHAVGRLRAVEGQTGLVYGVGPIGSFVFLVAKYLGAKRLAVVDLNPHHLSTLAGLGADLVVNAAECDPVDAVLKWTEGRGVDFAVDAVGRSICRRNTLACAAPGATLAWVGLGEDICDVDGRIVVTREIEIKGSYAYGLQDFGRSIALLEQKCLPLTSLVTESAFSDGQTIFEELASGHSSLMKAVFRL